MGFLKLFVKLVAVFIKLLIVIVVTVVCGIPHILYMRAEQEGYCLKEDVDQLRDEYERGA